jgi:hypothetical protein
MVSSVSDIYTKSQDVSCMVFIYEIPLQNALLDQKHALKPAKWKSDCQLRIVDERTMQETIITVPTSAVAKNAAIAKPVVIDKYVKQGANKLRVQSIGERFCLVVRLIASRSLGDVLSDMSKIDDAAENLNWGKEALLTQLGAGDEDDELMVTELDVSLKDPLSCARIKTPARGRDCQHFTCFDLETYLQYANRYGSWKCQLCSKELNPREIKVCQRFQEILSKTDSETESCKLNAEFEISNAKREVIGEKGKIDGIDAKKPDAGAAAHDNLQLHQAAVPAGTLEEQLQQTNLWCALCCSRAGEALGGPLGVPCMQCSVPCEPGVSCRHLLGAKHDTRLDLAACRLQGVYKGGGRLLPEPSTQCQRWKGVAVRQRRH